jgi:hypothetical protein
MRVLVVAPHADDETLGAGGAIARHAREGDEITVAVMTGPGEGRHPVFPNELWDIVRDEAEEAAAVLGVKDLVFRELPAVLVPDRPVWEVNGVAAEVLEQAAPEILYVPSPSTSTAITARSSTPSRSLGARRRSSGGGSTRSTRTKRSPRDASEPCLPRGRLHARRTRTSTSTVNST